LDRIKVQSDLEFKLNFKYTQAHLSASPLSPLPHVEQTSNRRTPLAIACRIAGTTSLPPPSRHSPQGLRPLEPAAAAHPALLFSPRRTPLKNGVVHHWCQLSLPPPPAPFPTQMNHAQPSSAPSTSCPSQLNRAPPTPPGLESPRRHPPSLSEHRPFTFHPFWPMPNLSLSLPPQVTGPHPSFPQALVGLLRRRTRHQ
jgi:hypothetical protein